jgi:hypothetical protein
LILLILCSLQSALAGSTPSVLHFDGLQLVNGTYSLDTLALFGGSIELNVALTIGELYGDYSIGVAVLQSQNATEQTFFSVLCDALRMCALAPLSLLVLSVRSGSVLS